jgi:tRNA(fMet)-specific endonuclease VapC
MMTRYEILRGLHAKRAISQLAAFEQFCALNEVLPITDAIIARAASIYGDLHQRGQLIGDADIIIAATTLESGLEIVTNNTSHFARIAGITLQNWLNP